MLYPFVQLEGKDDIEHGFIVKDEIIKSLGQKLSEANRLTETMKFRPQQMEQECKCRECHPVFNNENTLTFIFKIGIKPYQQTTYFKNLKVNGFYRSK